VSLQAALETQLPARLPVGQPDALFLLGTCRHPGARVEELELLVDGTRHAAAAWGMPRTVDGRRERSGFWGTVTLPARERPGKIELGLSALVAGGGREVARLGTVAIVEREAPPPTRAKPEQPEGEPLIAVCMGTFDPDPKLFNQQVESLRAQTDRRWICLISDDHSSPEAYERIRATVRDDPRFAVGRAPARGGFYRNFERTLGLVPAEAELVALCDQDDRWDPEKLEVLRRELGSAALVYSDQRLVDIDGHVLRDTMWRGRRNNHTDLTSMLVANTITGAATLFRRELVDPLLPFPDMPGWQFHDHWLALVALASGEVSYVDRPLYDYVQHASAVFGDVTRGRRPRRERPRHDACTRLRGDYFYGYLGREVLARALLERCGHKLTPAKRRDLERFVRAQRSPLAVLWLAARPLRALAGRTETLGAEGALALGLLWRRVIAVCARLPRLAGPACCDASLPPLDSFDQRRLRRWRARV
jgi:glycosyltransferase involved in cell wall biosynthesis